MYAFKQKTNKNVERTETMKTVNTFDILIAIYENVHRDTDDIDECSVEDLDAIYPQMWEELQDDLKKHINDTAYRIIKEDMETIVEYYGKRQFIAGFEAGIKVCKELEKI